MAAFASICAHTDKDALTHSHYTHCTHCVKATYSLKVSNQQSWRWFVSLPSLFGIINLNCFASDKRWKTHRIYIRCLVVGCGAAPSEGCLSFFFLLFLAASPAFVLASLLLRATFFLLAVSADPSLSDESTCTVFSLAFLALLLLLHFSFLASPVFGWSHGCTFLYLRCRAFTCVGALLLSSSAPAVWAQSSRL